MVEDERGDLDGGRGLLDFVDEGFECLDSGLLEFGAVAF